MAWLRDLQPGEMQAVWAGEARREVLLANVAGTVYAMDNVCSHSGGSLASGWLDGTVVTCGLHGWQYELKTGVCPHVPNERLETFPVAIEDGGIVVELPWVVTTPGPASGAYL
ncbi:MAG: Rieske (2Fe-2S) protein [Chloroflexota bacterium]